MPQMLIIAAGGTIDAQEYDFDTGSVISFRKPAAVEIIQKSMPGIASENISFVSPFQKDSDVMTEADRAQIKDLCERSSCKRILITHGTGTMIETGRLLASQVKDKTIVLTGSLPFSFDPLFASFNLGNAVMACKLLPAGVYIVSSGAIAPIDGSEIEKVKHGEVTYFVSPSTP